jgi:alkylation response protein AidB-like acyl-CoA dehydrogenase
MENASELQSASVPPLTEREQSLLAAARAICDSFIEPRAEEVDMRGEVPVENLSALAAAGLIGVTTPTEYGGSAGSGAFMREYTEVLTAACGSTWFILTQHYGACGMVASNAVLREKILREMAAGRHYVGVGFGHLRRPDPVLRAEAVENGWLLNGTAPWVTGWPILSGVIFGAVLPDERHVYVYADVAESDAMISTPPLPLCAMNATATTEVRLTNLFVPQENFIKYSSREQMAKGDEGGIAGAVAPPLGCAMGSLRFLRRIARKRKHLTFIAETADALEAEIAACRTEARRWADGPKDIPEYKPGALNARAWAIELGVRAAHMGVAAASGTANGLDSPAQRRFREAMFYTLTAQTSDIMGATLGRLRREQGAA